MANKTIAEVKEQETKYNQASDTEIINEWYKRNQVGEYYLIDDKPNNTLNLYYQGNLIASFPAIHGKNNSPTGMKYAKRADGVMTTDSIWSSPDEATVTYIESDGTIKNLAGNLTTPAGIFYTVKSGDYNGHPGYIRQTLSQYADEKGDAIPAGIHVRKFTPGDGSNTNGCTGISAESMKRLDNYIKNNAIKTYVLPQDPDNKFQIRNNEIEFISTNNNPNIYQTKSTTITPLNDIEYNKAELSDQQIQNINQFIYGLKKYKPLLLKKLKQYGVTIPSDVYDQLAVGSLSILGAESNYGQTNGPIENFFRFGIKGGITALNNLFGLNIPGIGGADYLSEYRTYKQNEDSNSIGPTSIRYKWNNDIISAILKDLDITKDDVVNRFDYAAIATMLRLAQEYNDRGKSVDNAINSWNASDAYSTYLDSIQTKRQFTGITSYPFDKQGGKLNRLSSFLKYKKGGSIQTSPFTKDNLRNTFSAWFTDDQVNKMNKMYNHMKNVLGWSDRNIAAAFGNIMQETAFKYSDNWEDSPFGAFQFLGGRKEHFEKWAKQNGYRLGSLSTASYLDYIINNAIDGRMDTVLRARELAKTGKPVDVEKANEVLSWADPAIKNGTFYPVADLTKAWADESLDLEYVTKLFANTIERAKDFEINMNGRTDAANKIYSIISI